MLYFLRVLPIEWFYMHRLVYWCLTAPVPRHPLVSCSQALVFCLLHWSNFCSFLALWHQFLPCVRSFPALRHQFFACCAGPVLESCLLCVLHPSGSGGFLLFSCLLCLNARLLVLRPSMPECPSSCSQASDFCLRCPAPQATYDWRSGALPILLFAWFRCPTGFCTYLFC